MTEISHPDPAELIWHQYKGKCTRDESGRLTGLNLCAEGLNDDSIEELFLQEDLSQLQALNLSENHLTQLVIPPTAQSLRHLNVSENPSLQHLKLDGTFPHLETLNASECALEGFDVPAGCDGLRILDLHKNTLTSFTFDGDCPKLESLDLASNQLKSLILPEGLQNLLYLYLPDNQLEQVNYPSALSKLKTFHLRNNKLQILPYFLMKFWDLEALYLHNNPLTDVPPEFIHPEEQGNSLRTVKDYLTEIGKGTLVNDRVKIIIVGNGRVGKSSLLRRLRDEAFNSEEPYTHGVHLGKLNKDHLPKVKTEDLRANVWDFGGQEIFYATHQFFLSDDALYLLAWTAEENVLVHRERDHGQLPFDEKWQPIDYWLENIRQRSGHSPIIMVQTHWDQIQTHIKEVYQQEPYQAVCINFSAVEGLGLDQLRYVMAEKLNSGIHNFGDNFPITYDRVIELIEVRKQEVPTISLDEFFSICQEANVSEGGEGSLMYYLHKTGVVVYFGNPEKLSDEKTLPDSHPLAHIVYIDPDWLTRQVYRLINNQLRAREGRIDIAYLEEMLPDYSPEEVSRFLELLQQFELIFQESEDVYIAPQYLPEELTGPAGVLFASIFEGLNQAFAFRFSRFTPDNVMINFLSRYGPYSNKLYWKNGIYFNSSDGIKCIVTYQEDEKSLVLYTDPNEKNLILQQEIFRAFVELSQNANAEISVADMPFVSCQEIEKAIKLKSPNVMAVDGETLVGMEQLMHLFQEGEMAYEENVRGFKRQKKTEEDAEITYKGNLLQPNENPPLVQNDPNKTHKDHIEDLLKIGDLGPAIEAFLEGAKASGQDRLVNDLLLQSGRYHSNERDRNSGLLDEGIYMRTRNQLMVSIRSYLRNYQPTLPYPGPVVPAMPTPQGQRDGMPNSAAKKILFVAANPTDQARMQTDREHRILKSELERGRSREKFTFLPPQFAVTNTELLRAIDDKPEIIHFAGHGEENGIIITDNQNKAKRLSTAALKILFNTLKGIVEIVILNACYSADQAKEISKLGAYVVGNNLPIGDEAAISFSKGFYNRLGDGNNFFEALNGAMFILVDENEKYANVIEVWKDGEKLDI